MFSILHKLTTLNPQSFILVHRTLPALHKHHRRPRPGKSPIVHLRLPVSFIHRRSPFVHSPLLLKLKGCFCFLDLVLRNIFITGNSCSKIMVGVDFKLQFCNQVNSQLISNVCTDALSAKKCYYFIRLMGLKASHLALECTLQSHPNMVLVNFLHVIFVTLFKLGQNKVCGVYRNPGPLQYDGPGADSRVIILSVENLDYMGRIKELNEYLDKNYKPLEDESALVNPFMIVMNKEHHGYHRLYGRGVTIKLMAVIHYT